MADLIVGLDIGTSAVRAAELDVSSKPPKLLNYGQIGLPPDSVVNGEIHDATAVSEAVRRLWKNGRFSATSVIVGIAGLRAITREIDLPFVPDNEVDSAVRFHSEEVIPFPPDKTILSSQVLSDYTSPEGAKMRRVLVAAAHADLVEGVVAVAENAGLVVEGVDLVSSALVRARRDWARSWRAPASRWWSSIRTGARSSSAPSGQVAMPPPPPSPPLSTCPWPMPRRSNAAWGIPPLRCKPQCSQSK